ncbi:MAG: OmpP1/FadL family transporter, partial [bacterium]
MRMTMRGRTRAAATAGLGLAMLVTAANAGGFAVREQSAEFQGTSFAGTAAGGGGLSSMFWNPAAAAQFDGVWSDSSYSLVIPDSDIHVLPGSTSLGDSGDIGRLSIVSGSYFSYQVSQDLILAMGINSPFGLSGKPSNRAWGGAEQARTSDLKTYNFSPTLAYRVTPTLAVGVGLQIEYLSTHLKNASGGPAGPTQYVEGDDTAFGFTAGVLWNARPGTSVGLGFRSSIGHTIEGTAGILGITPPVGVNVDLDTPETVTLSVRQAINPQLAALGTVEWTNWSRLGTLDVVCPSCGSTIKSLQLDLHDGWFVSGGLEYAYSPKLTLRTGIAWERSPIRDPDERTPRMPDADRIWTSIGTSYKWSPTTTIDFSYSHIFVDDSRINRVENGATLIADVDSSIDIVSVGVRMKL